MIAIRTIAETSSPASPPPPGLATGDATTPAGDGTGLWEGASVTEDRAGGDEGDAGDGLLHAPPDDGLAIARETLRVFADDLTDESAARLRSVVDGADAYEWGELA